VVDQQLDTLREKIQRMEVAREFLEHVASFHDAAPDGCPRYETLIWDRHGSHGHTPHASTDRARHSAHDHDWPD